ncbi:MAG: hypothetical protein WBA57_00450 [Elainellaceae cyanobacterium]
MIRLLITVVRSHIVVSRLTLKNQKFLLLGVVTVPHAPATRSNNQGAADYSTAKIIQTIHNLIWSSDIMIIGLRHAQITVAPEQEQAAKEFCCNGLNLPEVPKPASLRSSEGFWLNVRKFNVHVGVECGVDRTRTQVPLTYEVTDSSH